jgi:heme-degrading monooxygenase HmoA
MIVTVFRSRLRPGAQKEYEPMAARMSALVKTIPGYISHKGFVAEDGERVTIVEFESEEALGKWRIHPEHAEAKRYGTEHFFGEYRVQICTVVRDRSWTVGGGAAQRRPINVT